MEFIFLLPRESDEINVPFSFEQEMLTIPLINVVKIITRSLRNIWVNIPFVSVMISCHTIQVNILQPVKADIFWVCPRLGSSKVFL